jgi:hypothetical protein
VVAAAASDTARQQHALHVDGGVAHRQLHVHNHAHPARGRLLAVLLLLCLLQPASSIGCRHMRIACCRQACAQACSQLQQHTRAVRAHCQLECSD